MQFYLQLSAFGSPTAQSTGQQNAFHPGPVQGQFHSKRTRYNNIESFSFSGISNPKNNDPETLSMVFARLEVSNNSIVISFKV